MHPALSVIFFTVASGAGYGLFILLALAHLLGLGDVDGKTLLWGGLLSLLLITAGLLSSVGHLANPKNAWRAFFRFKTSWLSREGVFAVLFYPFGFCYLLLAWLSDGAVGALTLVLGGVAVLLALITVFCTGMIYGCLKTIRQWNTSLTPTNYLLLGLASGCVVLVLVLLLTGQQADAMAGLGVALLVLAALAKGVYYFWMRTLSGPTINTATGFTRAQVRLLDAGHTAGTFLTDEFGYQAPLNQLFWMKVGVFVFGFVVPVLGLGAVLAGVGGGWFAGLAVVSVFVGVGAERWLFFAEARHVVNLYHGAQRT